MNWSKGYSTRHYISIVDPETWKDIERIEISSGSINRKDDSLLESADLTCEYTLGQTTFERERWVRIYADIRQDEDNYHGSLFTGLVSSPSRNIDGTFMQNRVQCYSVLKPADDVLLPRGWYASAHTDATKIIKELLSVSPAPIQIESVTGELAETIIAEENETNLSMAWKILDLMNWRIRIDGNGYMYITSYPMITNDLVKFDSLKNDSLETNISVNYDWFDCPNVFRAVYNTAIAIAKDEDPESPLSIQNRGREVWMEEKDCKLQTNESIAMYAKRRLKEEQNVAYELSYNRRFHPDVNIHDIIQLNYPAQNITGYFTINQQTISLGYSISVSETAMKKV